MHKSFASERYRIFDFQTKERFEIRDVTDDVCKMVLDSGVKLGLVNVQSMHTTAAVLVNENEPLLHEDFKRHLDEMLPVDHTEYRHD